MPKPEKWFTLQINADGDEFQGPQFAGAIMNLLEIAAKNVEAGTLRGTFDNQRGNWRLSTPEDYELSDYTPQTYFTVYINCVDEHFEGDKLHPEIVRILRSLQGQVATARWSGALMRDSHTYGNWRSVIGPNYQRNPPRKQPILAPSPIKRRRKT